MEKEIVDGKVKSGMRAELADAVAVIKTAIMQSQARAVSGVNQEQLALYYGVGRFISVNTRKRNWGTGVIDGISERLKAELPGLRGFIAPAINYIDSSALKCAKHQTQNTSISPPCF